MYPMREIKTIRMILHVTLVILLILLLTHKLWVDPLVYYIVAHFYGVPMAEIWQK